MVEVFISQFFVHFDKLFKKYLKLIYIFVISGGALQ